MSESLKQKAKTGFEIETEIGSLRCMNVGTAKQKIGRDKRLQTLLEEKWVLVSVAEGYLQVAQQEIAMQVEKAKDPLQIKINALQLAILSIYKPKSEGLERERGLQKHTCDEIRAKLKFLDYEQYHGDLAQSLNPALREINQLLEGLRK